MPSIKSLEMAAVVSAHNNITIKKSLFSTKATYTPTGSPVKALLLEYSPSEGERVERLLNMSPEKMVTEIQQKGKPAAISANGNFRLEVCLSKDHQFCALQLFRFGGLGYHSLFESRFYEGETVEQIVRLF